VATRSKRPIATEEIPRIFDDACIEELAQIGKLLAFADMKRFAEAIREAARIYATNVREHPSLLQAIGCRGTITSRLQAHLQDFVIFRSWWRYGISL
jgi:hypothetical protein